MGEIEENEFELQDNSKYTFDFLVKNINEIKLETKIKSDKGDIYVLKETEYGGKIIRKFSRTQGTKLRFMTYDNIGKTFKDMSDIDIQNLEETDIRISKCWSNETRIDDNLININRLINAVKQLDKKIKEMK